MHSYKYNYIMKRLLIMALLALPHFALAQSLTINEHKDGMHIVSTDMQICRSFTDRMVLAVGMYAGKTDTSDKYTYFLKLKITSANKIYVERGATLRLWLKGGQVIKLTAVDDNDNGLVRDIHAVNGLVTHDYSSYPSFVVTESQIKDIITYGVEQVQCDSKPDTYTKAFKKDKVGEAIAERWKLLQKTLFPNSAYTKSIDNPEKHVFFPKAFDANRGVSFGLIGAGLEGFKYGAIGFNTTIWGVYFDFMGWPRKHANNVAVGEWKDHSAWGAHIGYQIPIHKYGGSSFRIVPMVGYTSVSVGVTDGWDWTVGDHGIINKFHTTEKTQGFDYGAAIVFQNPDDKIGGYNLSFGFTKRTMWIGLAWDFQFKTFGRIAR